MSDVMLKPWALSTLEAAREYIRPGKVEQLDAESVDAALIQFVNEASGVLQGATGRKLAARPYVDQFGLANCDTTLEQKVLTTADYANVRNGMVVAGAGVVDGAFITAESASAPEMNLAAEQTLVGVTLTFIGAGHMVLDGSGESELRVPEWPVTEVIAATSIGTDGSATALNVSGARSRANRILLTNDVFPEGRMNIHLSCVAGFKTGYWDEQRQELENACLRLVSVMFNDWKDKVGRGTNVSIQGFSMTFMDKGLPADVQKIVDRYARKS